MATLADIEAQLYNHPSVKRVKRVRDEGGLVVYEAKYTFDGMSLHTVYVSVEVFNRGLPNEEAYFVGGAPPFLYDYSFCRDAEAYMATKADGIGAVGFHTVFCDGRGGVAEFDVYKPDSSGGGNVVVERYIVYSDGSTLKYGRRA